MIHPLITRDPVTGGELLVTRLEGPESEVVIEGRFSLGWMGRLSPEQLEFVGVLVKHRGNIQKVAAELHVAYNTARNHLDDIVAALERPAPSTTLSRLSHMEVLQRLADGQMSFENALNSLQER